MKSHYNTAFICSPLWPYEKTTGSGGEIDPGQGTSQGWEDHWEVTALVWLCHCGRGTWARTPPLGQGKISASSLDSGKLVGKEELLGVLKPDFFPSKHLQRLEWESE